MIPSLIAAGAILALNEKILDLQHTSAGLHCRHCWHYLDNVFIAIECTTARSVLESEGFRRSSLGTVACFQISFECQVQ